MTCSEKEPKIAFFNTLENTWGLPKYVQKLKDIKTHFFGPVTFFPKVNRLGATANLVYASILENF